MSILIKIVGVSVIFILLPLYGFSEVACNLGSALYPNDAHYVNGWPSPVYYNTNPIPLRTWDGDPKCGIRDNRITPAGGGCAVENGSGSFFGGALVNYDPRENNCPIDDYIPIFIVISAGFGFFFIKKKLVIS